MQGSLFRAIFGVLGAAMVASASSLPAPSHNPMNSLTAPAIYGKVLPNDWNLSPVGHFTQLGNMPFGMALSPDGRLLAVVNSGLRANTLDLISAANGSILQQLSLPSSFLGVSFSNNGTLYVSGGPKNAVYEFSNGANGYQLSRTFSVPGYPAGLCVNGSHLLVAQNLANSLAVINLQTGTVTHEIPTGLYPYGVTMVSGHIFVSNWGSHSLTVASPTNFTPQDTISVGQNPSALVSMPNGPLYVANTNSDSISSVDPTTLKVTHTISVSYHGLPNGTAPNALSLSPDGRILYVALAGLNAVGVIDTRTGVLKGNIPTDWYPTGVATSPDNGHIYILSGKGGGSGPNIDGPNPTLPPGSPNYDGYTNTSPQEYTGTMQNGTLAIVSRPSPATLAQWTRQVDSNALVNRLPVTTVPKLPIKHVFFILKENRTYDQVLGDVPQGNGSPELTLFGKKITPNTHKLVNRYVLLDNFYADSEITAQGHMWVTGAYSTDYVEKTWMDYYGKGGRSWDAGQAPVSYPSNQFIFQSLLKAHKTFRVYGEPIFLDSTLYDTARAALPSQVVNEIVKGLDAGLGGSPNNTYDPVLGPIQSAHPEDFASVFAHDLQSDQTVQNMMSKAILNSTALVSVFQNNPTFDKMLASAWSHYNFNYASFNLKVQDLTREAVWQKDFATQLAQNAVPSFQYIWLPDNHTAGTATGYPTPYAEVANNDAALGKIIQTLSHSSIWQSSVVFVVEDDAQNGPDHVDAHRTVAMAIGPWIAQHKVVSTHYDQLSMMRTMELLLGLKPLSLFDASALPMADIFTTKPNGQRYTAVPLTVPWSETNNPSNPTARASNQLNWSGIQHNNPMTMNEILWYSLKGTPYPNYPGRPSLVPLSGYRAPHS